MSRHTFHGSAIEPQAFKIIQNVEAFLEDEKRRGGSKHPVTQVSLRLAEATGLSAGGIRLLKARYRDVPVEQWVTPGRTRNRRAPVVDLDESAKSSIRQIVRGMLARKKQATVEEMMLEVKRAGVNYVGQKSSFRKVLSRLGFHWKKLDKKGWVLEVDQSKEPNKLEEFVAVTMKNEDWSVELAKEEEDPLEVKPQETLSVKVEQLPLEVKLEEED